LVNVLAFDLGASSGRAVLGQLTHEHGGKLIVTDTHRFPNDPVRVHNHLHWDILRLLHEIKQALVQTRLQGYQQIASLGIDAWGVDFGLLGRSGELLANPYHYRDGQTTGMLEEVDQIIERGDLFARTGIQFMAINTLYQLYALKKAGSLLLDQAETLLFIPELLRYFLTAERRSEWTVASTSQLCNPYSRTWDRELLAQLGLPTHIFLDPQEPGTLAGTLLPAICEEVGIASIPVIAVAEHDTASAVIAVPAEGTDFAYLSCGTWSLIGTETPQPIMNEQALALNITNEGGINGTTRLLKNITGLWLLQECRRVWSNEGRLISYADEGAHIAAAQPLQCFINPDDPMFVNPSHMPRQIQHYCRQTGQCVPESTGDVLRCIIDSLALQHRFVLERIEGLVQKRFAGLHIVGGGAQNVALCQCTANALGREVWAGPHEGTAIGNVLVQCIALGEIESVQQARRIVRNSFPIKTYQPENVDVWEKAYELFRQVTGQ
jgi:rhamnulokinase